MSAHHAALDVGTPARGFRDWERRVIRCHGFADLTTTKGEWVESPEFKCFGHRWSVMICPGGATDSRDGMVSVFLYNMSAKSIKVEFGFSVKGSHGNDIAGRCWGSDRSVLFEPVHSPRKGHGGLPQGCINFAERSDLLSALVGGALVMEVRVKCADPSVASPPFVAENPSCHMVRNLFLDEESADVVFELGEDGRRHPDSKKRSRTEPVKFHAHRFILKQSAPMLAALCPPGDNAVAVSIADMTPEVFRPLLSYLYGREVGDDDYKSHAREIIEAADRYEIVGLKLTAEAWYVQSSEINLDNVMELLLYSDAKNLALLKEAAMDFIVDRREDVLRKVPLNEVPGGLFADLLAATGREITKIRGDAENADFGTMRISDLRKRLHAKGLGIDGSRETLIAALEQSE